MNPNRLIHHQPSWRVATCEVEAFVTRLGGQLGPVDFRLGRRRIQPFSVAPWHGEPAAGLPPILRVLRGDFFCLPFGNNARAFRGERHPPHGETANRPWRCVSAGAGNIQLRMTTRARPGRVDKFIVLRPGETAIYQQHVVHGFAGPANFGHHAMLRFPDEEGSGALSTSPFAWGQVAPEFESPAGGGYSALRAGARFRSLARVPGADGGRHDLTRYPARRGYEDLAMLVGRARGRLAWTAVTFPRERYVWFALKDPRVLTNTVLWHSNGGRHSAPWNGRHRNVLGLEEVTSYFHYGLAESAADNPVRRQGGVTVLRLGQRQPLVVNYIMAVAAIPAGFDRVRTLVAARDERSVRLRSASGREIELPLDVAFLHAPALG